MRQRQLKQLWKRLHELAGMELTRDELLMKLGAARHQSPTAWRLVHIDLPEEEAAVAVHPAQERLRQVRRREGRYLLRTNLVGRDPAQLWEFYIQLAQVEEAFKNLKGDLALRPSTIRRRSGLKRISSWPSWPMPARDVASPVARSCPWTNPSFGAGKVWRGANDRCPSSHDRWSQSHHVTLYPAGAGAPNIAQAVAVVFTQSAATPGNGQRRSDPIALCSEDLWDTLLDFTGIIIDIHPESAKSS